ncbi:MAG TPA: hypothetical protein VFE32_19235 [Puia sp.]|jgi:hypothetical protein|nr:hypothetical protein [Puia sp.]
MKKIYWALILMFSLIGEKAVAQHTDIMEALAKEGGKINTKLPIIDSLLPFKVNKMQLSNLREKFALTKNEASEIHKIIEKSRGERLNATEMPGTLLISASLLYNGDTLNVSFMGKNKPFYILSIPILFDHGEKAVIDVDLVGGGGYTYLLIKQQGQWVVEKEIVRWVV